MTETVDSGWTLPAELQELAAGGDEGIVEELIAMFKDDVAARLEALRAAVHGSDLATVKAQAHTVKGSAVQMGATSLMLICHHLELDASHLVTENLDRLLREAEHEFARLQLTMHA